MADLPGKPTTARGLEALQQYIGELFKADAFEGESENAGVVICRRMIADLDRICADREEHRRETAEALDSTRRYRNLRDGGR